MVVILASFLSLIVIDFPEKTQSFVTMRVYEDYIGWILQYHGTNGRWMNNLMPVLAVGWSLIIDIRNNEGKLNVCLRLRS